MCYINRFSLLWNVDLFRALFLMLFHVPCLGDWDCVCCVCVLRVCMNKYKTIIVLVFVVYAAFTLQKSIFLQGIWALVVYGWLRSESPPRDIELTINVTVNCIVHIFFTSSFPHLFLLMALFSHLVSVQFIVKWSCSYKKKTTFVALMHKHPTHSRVFRFSLTISISQIDKIILNEQRTRWEKKVKFNFTSVLSKFHSHLQQVSRWQEEKSNDGKNIIRIEM